MIRILFICHGNICRSPMAEFVFRKKAAERGVSPLFSVSSAATSTEIPYPLRGLGEREVRFTKVIDAEDMPAAVLEWC